METGDSSPLTRGDLRHEVGILRQEMAVLRGEVKEDIDGLRDELKGDIAALRGELTGEISASRGESKRDIAALRDELKGVDRTIRRDVALRFDRVESELREMKEVMATKDDINRVIAVVEGFAAKSNTYERAMVLHGQALTEAQVQLKDHESRIKTLETRPPGDSPS
jgi:chromosome segregation ATPase